MHSHTARYGYRYDRGSNELYLSNLTNGQQSGWIYIGHTRTAVDKIVYVPKRVKMMQKRDGVVTGEKQPCSKANLIEEHYKQANQGRTSEPDARDGLVETHRRREAREIEQLVLS